MYYIIKCILLLYYAANLGFLFISDNTCTEVLQCEDGGGCPHTVIQQNSIAIALILQQGETLANE